MSAEFLQKKKYRRTTKFRNTIKINPIVDKPAGAVDPNIFVLLSGLCLLCSRRVQVVLETLGKVLVAVWILLVFDRCWLPAPDLVQLDVDARLDMFAHIAIRKGAAGAKSGRVEGLENKFDEDKADFQLILTLYPLNLYL